MPPLPMWVAVLTALVVASPAAAADTAVPVVWEAPACGHDKLGQVSIQAGTRVNETTRDTMLPTVGYRQAMNELATAAKAQGGDAVVVRSHQATYFTRNGRRSHKPVHIRMRGAAIRTHADAGPCRFALADPRELEESASRGEPVEVSSSDAYRD